MFFLDKKSETLSNSNIPFLHCDCDSNFKLAKNWSRSMYSHVILTFFAFFENFTFVLNVALIAWNRNHFSITINEINNMNTFYRLKSVLPIKLWIKIKELLTASLGAQKYFKIEVFCYTSSRTLIWFVMLWIIYFMFYETWKLEYSIFKECRSI